MVQECLELGGRVGIRLPGCLRGLVGRLNGHLEQTSKSQRVAELVDALPVFAQQRAQLRGRNREDKSASRAQLALDGYISKVEMNELLGNAEAQAESLAAPRR